ncbi:MAG TPA: LysM peptidoglycan-binding domain-containing M23 family metallopeptidase [Rhizomicrobium sp.]|nr:LysM peptidoglycan-binding domain-containing M23 family metallopeptidase [Rhizomicrobium sp.]
MRAHRRTETAQAAGADASRVLACALLLFVLAGCAAPSPRTYFDWPAATYLTVVVHQGDTVSEIAARYDVPTDRVLAMNDLQALSPIYPGEVLRLPPGSRATREAVLHDAESNRAPAPPPVRTAGVTPDPRPAYALARRAGQSVASGDSGKFIWPLSGTVIEGFGAMAGGTRNDGINIAVPEGTPIRAAQAGTISYAGNELRGYGNLVLIRHDGSYITAYAHAERIVVAKGEHVEQGQVIGYAGASGDVSRPQLHFEIRRDSKPVDPQALLAATS